MPSSDGNGIERTTARQRSDSWRSLFTECSVGTQTLTNAPIVERDDDDDGRKYLEILVHNVSHTALVMGLSSGDGNGDVVSRPSSEGATDDATTRSDEGVVDGCDKRYIIFRPRFSAFDMFTRRVLCELRGQIESSTSSSSSEGGGVVHSGDTSSSCRHPLHRKVISYPRYERSGKKARYTLVTPRPGDRYMLPVGFDLERIDGINNTTIDPIEMQSLRLRGRDIGKVDRHLLGDTPRRLDVRRRRRTREDSIHDDESPHDHSSAGRETLRINAAFFPLLAILLPRWLGKIADKFGGTRDETMLVAAPPQTPNVKKVVVLVSGVGTPRNWTHSMTGNSTQTCAEIMELFIHVLYPDITVVR